MGASFYATIIANFIGGAIFFWVDRFIFTSKAIEIWHIKEGKCVLYRGPHMDYAIRQGYTQGRLYRKSAGAKDSALDTGKI